jgi:LemA protein
MKLLKIIMVALVSLLLTSCGYNTMGDLDEEVKAAHSQVLSVYKKRADLVPNLVSVVKNYAAHEESVFTEVTESRAKAGQVTLPENATPEDVKKFSEAQKSFGNSLSRLLVVAENYPQLKADQGFLKLQDQLETIENQATASRNKYIRAIKEYNKVVRSFPNNLTASWFDHKIKPQVEFDDEEEIKKAPKIEF